ncbi:MAG: hypothetical protein ABIY51_04080, partial [Ferruginibacter sp.]
MKQIFTIFVLSFFSVQLLSAQTVSSSTINFSELAAYEASHPNIGRLCKTCPRHVENDRWEGLDNPNMPISRDANIKKQEFFPITNNPTAVSRSPLQQWLGHIDPGTSIPPDTHGAVGINHVITATNDFVKIHTKVGGAQVSQVSISTFTGVGGTCDPYMTFDPTAQRWIFSAINCSNSSSNPMILMVSNTSDPTGLWRKITWVPVGSGLFLDHPYVGFDNQWIVLSGRRFAPGFQGPSLFLVDKAAMYAGTAIAFGTNAQQIDKTAGDGDSPLPVTVYDPPFSTVGNPSPGTFYVMQAWSSSTIRLTTVTGTIPTATWNTSTPVFPTGGTPWNNGNIGNAAEQMVETRKLAVNDARISCGVMMNGKIWCSQHIGFPTSGTPDRIAVQWWQLDGSPGANFGNVLQRGRIGGNNANEYKFFSSIAVNKDEDVLIGYTSSTNTTRVSSAYATRQATTPSNTTDDELIYKTGLNRYWKDFSSGRARWGDYSHSSLDPVDGSLWTVQEYAEQGLGGGVPPDNNSRYGVWWAQVAASNTPATPIIVASSSSLITEGCSPANSAIDPNESVTVSFCLQNSGTGPSTNLVATLLSTGGVTAPSGPQNYGVLINGGSAVCRNFTFTANGTCGGTIIATLQLQDGATNLGTATYTFTLGGTLTTFTQNFDAVVVPALPAGWVATNASGTGLWVSSNSGTPTPVAASLPNSILVDDPAAITDKRIETPSIAITSATAKLSFSQNFDLEPGFDGGVLEIAIGAGAYQDILAAGGSFSAGGYNGTIDPTFGNPLAGRAAWTGNSGGFNTTTVNLPAAAVGQSIKFRFRMGSDNSVNASGWRVDNVLISEPACCAGCSNVSIATQPANTTACTNGNATFTVVAGGSSPTYQWQISTTGAGGPFTDLTNTAPYSGVTTATLTITSATLALSGNYYRAVVSNSCPSTVNSNGGLLTVSNTATITGQPANATICAGSNTSFAVTTTGSSLTYQWQVSTTGAGGPWTGLTNVAPYSGVATATLNITAAPAALNNNQYRVVVSSCSGPINSNPALLTVNSPVAITTQPTGQTVCEGANVTFTSVSSGTGLTYQWQISTAGAGGPWSSITGQTNPTLTLNAVTASMTGYAYRVIVTGTCTPGGVTSNAAVLTVNTLVTISAQPVSIAVCAGQNATFSVTATGTGLTYQWQISTNSGGTWTNITGANSATLNLGAATFAMNGNQYRVVLNGTCTTNLNSSAATLTVNLPVQFTTQPVNAAVCAGSSTSYTVTTLAFPTGSPVTYQWQESINGGAFTNLSNGSPYSGVTTATLTINPAAINLNGRSYRVVAAGQSCGSVNSNTATITVNALPVPVLTASSYASITPYTRSGLYVTVSPAGSYSYAWYKNSFLDPSRTGSFFNATVDDFGDYAVVVTDLNTGCSNTTNRVTLK